MYFSVVSFETGDKMEEHLNQDNAMKKFLVGVRFDNIKPNSTLPKSTTVSTMKIKRQFYAFILHYNIYRINVLYIYVYVYYGILI